MARSRSSTIGRPRKTVDQNGIPDEVNPQIDDPASGVTTGPTRQLTGTPTEPENPHPEPPPEQ